MAATENKLFGWYLKLGHVTFERALIWQESLVKLRREGLARDTIITLEHPAVVTLGKDSHKENYDKLTVTPIRIDRGGDVTYHGPGQLVIYFIFNLARRGRDLHKFMSDIQDGIIITLDQYDIKARKGEEYTGVWVGKKKIASVGIAVKHWISYHGVAININTVLDDFKQINPCGLDSTIMTSMKEQLDKEIDMTGFAERLVSNYCKQFKTEFCAVDLESLAEDVESQAGGYEV